MITRLTLTNFRSHNTFRLDTEGKNVVITGNNGSGKTNVLESVSLLNGGTGLRHALSGDLARFGTDNYGVAAELSNGTDISVYWNTIFGHRKAKVNGDAVALSELSKHICIVWITPAEDQLFLTRPHHRRAFLDNLVTGFDARHTGRTARLAKLLSERAFAIKTGRDNNWLDLIDTNITETASAVADARTRYAAELNHFFDCGEMSLSGILESKIINGEKAGDFENTYRNYLFENRTLSGDKMTIDGPHKSDFSVLNKTLGLTADKTSSGQQKLLLNRLVIANAKLLYAKNPETPLLILLDEADSHLDKNARQELFGALSKTNAQIWMTGTDSAIFSAVPNSVSIGL